MLLVSSTFICCLCIGFKLNVLLQLIGEEINSLIQLGGGLVYIIYIIMLNVVCLVCRVAGVEI